MSAPSPRPTREEVDSALVAPHTEAARILAAEVRALRADVERLRARTHEIQAQEMAKRAHLDSLIDQMRARWDAAKRWTEDNELLAEWASGTGRSSPFWSMTSMNSRDALARLIGERDDARAELAGVEGERDAADDFAVSVRELLDVADEPGWGRQVHERIRVLLAARTPQPAADVGAEASGVLWMAMRYALGRATYAVQEVGSAIAQHAHRLEPWQRERMAQEIEREHGGLLDGAAWGPDAATWRQAISDLRAPQPAVPDGEHRLAPLSALDARQVAAVPALLAMCDEAEQLADGLPFLTTRGVRRAVAAAVPGEDVPARLEAAAAACEALGWTGTANTFRDLASQLREWDEEAPEVRSAVAAALARPTGHQP